MLKFLLKTHERVGWWYFYVIIFNNLNWALVNSFFLWYLNATSVLGWLGRKMFLIIFNWHFSLLIYCLKLIAKNVFITGELVKQLFFGFFFVSTVGRNVSLVRGYCIWILICKLSSWTSMSQIRFWMEVAGILIFIVQ